MALMEGELAALRQIRPNITLPIPTPRYHHSGAVGDTFIGYSLLPGQPLSHRRMHSLSDDTQQRIADQLATFLCELHTIPVHFDELDTKTEIGRLRSIIGQLFDIPPAELPFDRPISDTLPIYRGLYHAFRRHLYPHMRAEARRAITDHFTAYFTDPALHTFEPCWRHGDFGGENSLFDGTNVSGIIDFSFTGIGDPAIDIAAVSTYGDSFLARILSRYPEAARLLRRARFYRGLFALEEALHGVLHDDSAAFESGIADYR